MALLKQLKLFQQFYDLCLHLAIWFDIQTDKTGHEHDEYEKPGNRSNKNVERNQVSFANTFANPNTVMVVFLDADITIFAMVCILVF